MSLAAVVRAMVASGCTPEQIACVVEHEEEARESKAAERRAKDAERKRKQRAAGMGMVQGHAHSPDTAGAAASGF